VTGVVNPSNPRDEACSDITRLLGAHADGQLDAASTLEVDDHLGRCETCRERVQLDRAIRGSLKKAVRAKAPDAVRARLLAAMTADPAPSATAAAPALAVAQPSNARPSSPTKPSMLRHWRTMLPVASAAAMAMAWTGAAKLPLASSNVPTTRAGYDEIVNQFIEVHSRPMRPETPDPKMVRAFEREVGVPVKVPDFQKNTHFVGGRLLPVQGGERVSLLQYEVAQPNGTIQRVSLFIYDADKIQVRAADLAPRAVGTAQVRVGQARGYSVAVAQHGSVGYVVASEDENLSAELVAAAGN